MALKDIKIGQTTEEIVNRIGDNFAELDEGKEPAITKQTAFNKPFATTAPTANGTASAGTSQTVARGDHVHPTDNTRLAVNPDGTNPLLNVQNKINSTYIPDSILGQLEYKGTFEATTSGPLVAEHGWYYICTYPGLQNPDGTPQADGYQVGDWAVYNATTRSWDKVDNTDAVTMVNGRTGAIETYIGTHNPYTVYYKGDMVSDANGRIYVCIAGTPLSIPTYLTNKTYWLATGSVMGVKFNGEDVNVDANGVANIVLNLDEVAGTIAPATTVEYPINGVNYYGILISNTDTEFEVFVDSKKVVTQSFIDGNNIFIACAQSAGVTVEVRKLVGNVASSNKLYKHHLTFADGTNRYRVNVDIINSYSGTLNTLDLLKANAQGSYSASGMIVVSSEAKNVSRVIISSTVVQGSYLSMGTVGVPTETVFDLIVQNDTVTAL